ncbi:hypothetical protein ECZU03_36560 [Escherichia coli]|nr:hypothetical protein ECZU03_36560 [Escherichia coli]
MVCAPLPSAATSAAGTPTLQLPEASGGGVGFAVEHNAHHIARFPARAGAGDHQRLRMFGIVDNVIARHSVNGENRRGGVYRQIMAGAAGLPALSLTVALTV